MLNFIRFGVIAGSINLPPLLIEALIVGGGGGGGMDMGGGGGGGGVIYEAPTLFEPNVAIPVTIGEGGRGAPAGSTTVDGLTQPGAHQFTVSALNGEDTIFNTTTAYGGGFGASSYWAYTPNYGVPGNGASGGGASGYGNSASGTKLGGTGIEGQGHAGGSGYGQYYSGGGGGAGAVGTNATATPHGGAGIQYPQISDYYFGGGGGGAAYSLATGGNGGIGGGGGGAVGVTTGGAGLNDGSPGGGGSPVSQTNRPGGDAGANTGGGGGGGSHYNANNRGGNGGSGVVILKCPSGYEIVSIGLKYEKTTVGEQDFYTITEGSGTITFISPTSFVNGLTVTPINDYVVWLSCIAFEDTYGSLANVIADSNAREALCNDLSALRYMVRSSTILNAVFANSDWVTELDNSIYATKVPVMTSATTPSGIATGSAQYASPTNCQVWMPFDGSASTFFHTPINPTFPLYNQYQSTSTAYLYKCSIQSQSGYSVRLPKDFDIKVSSDGSNYTTICSKSFAQTDALQNVVFTDFTNFVAGNYWYFNIKNKFGDSYCSFSTFQFYGLDLS